MQYTEVARAGSERGELVLRERREDGARPVLELRANGVFVMDTEETSSETELGALALDLVESPRDVVIGGLGLGYTLRRVLADPRVERVTVVEVEEALIGWMRDGTVPHGPALLADRRVRIVNADIAMAIAEAREKHDLLLLDVDNGPGYLVHEDNAGLYSPAMLEQCRSLLADGGVVVVWSANPAPELLAALDGVFGNAEELPQQVLLQDRPEHYFLYVARR